MNAQFHLFQELTNQFTVVIVSDKINHKIPVMTDIPEMIKVHDIHLVENMPEMILDLKTKEVINSYENKRITFLVVLTNFLKLSKRNYMKF